LKKLHLRLSGMRGILFLGDVMVYFATGIMKLKLIILYFMCRAKVELTQNQIFSALAENGWMEFFDFQTTFVELEEDEYVCAISRPYGQAYSVTEKGQEAVDLFYETLPDSFRKAMDEYVQEHHQQLSRKSQFSARMTNLPGGGQQVRLKAFDGDAVLVDVALRLPDSDSAQKACDRWPDEAVGIYQELLQRLIMKE